MDKVQEELYEVCLNFLQLLQASKEEGLISDFEYESHIKFKKLFIQEMEKEKKPSI